VYNNETSSIYNNRTIVQFNYSFWFNPVLVHEPQNMFPLIADVL